MKGSCLRCVVVAALSVLLSHCRRGGSAEPRLSSTRMVFYRAGWTQESSASTREGMNMQVEILESAELRRRALDRVASRHSHLKGYTVEFKASTVTDTLLINVTASGSDENIRVFLDALLEEYQVYREDLTRQSGSLKTLPEIMAEVRQAEALYESALKAFRESTPETKASALVRKDEAWSRLNTLKKRVENGDVKWWHDPAVVVVPQ